VVRPFCLLLLLLLPPLLVLLLPSLSSARPPTDFRPTGSKPSLLMVVITPSANPKSPNFTVPP
jgi:hypothetical protein